MGTPNSEDLAQESRERRARATQLDLVARGFTLDHAAYHEGYKRLRTLYEKASAARQRLEKEAPGLRPEDVSNRIPGIIQGTTDARAALVGTDTGSLLGALRDVEERLANLLTDLHHSYVTYRRTDQESAFALLHTTRATDTP